jgi:hypothetical protein
MIGGWSDELLRLALNHQTAKLSFMSWQNVGLLRLALNHQTAKLDCELRLWKQGLFSYPRHTAAMLRASK